MSQQERGKIGRNEPCPCGSGKKFKRCHGRISNQFHVDLSKLRVRSEVHKLRKEAAETQRIQQQGKGRPIVSSACESHRIVAVGSRFTQISITDTFHDFLIKYIKTIMGTDWGETELGKPLEERHPLMQWYNKLCLFQRSEIEEASNGITSARMNGAVAGYLSLAYNLFLLEHNIALQAVLISRLKNPDQFRGAFYETFVAAHLIKAGYEIEFEDESDSSVSHCEFLATDPNTSKSFAVEAKSRKPGKSDARIHRQLKKALKKDANSTRLIFIDMNMYDSPKEYPENSWVHQAIEDLKLSEDRIQIDGEPAPPAYVILTNYPIWEHLDDDQFSFVAVAEGFKINDFGVSLEFPDLRSAIDSQANHKLIDQILESMREHSSIPSTFDGENPEFLNKEISNPLLIDAWYELNSGKIAQLKDVVVLENTSTAACLFRTLENETEIYSNHLSEAELAAYQRHPETFFGAYKPSFPEINNIVDAYNFLYATYSNTKKEDLLAFMTNHSDRETLSSLSQSELAKAYCERMATSLINSIEQNDEK